MTLRDIFMITLQRLSKYKPKMNCNFLRHLTQKTKELFGKSNDGLGSFLLEINEHTRSLLKIRIASM